MQTVTITRDLFTKQRKPQLICKAGTVAEITSFTMNDTVAIVKIPGREYDVAVFLGRDGKVN